MLASNLWDIVQQQENVPLFCLFLVDGSGSVAESDFNGPLKDAIIALAAKLSKATKCLVQFASTVVTECTPTTSVDTFVKMAKDMKQLRTSTATKDAMQNALVTMSAFKGTKILFIITDGCPSHGQDPKEVAQQIRNMGIQIHCLGVGAALGDQVLSDIAGGGLVYRLQDFKDFMQAIDRLTTEEMAKVNLLIPKFFLFNPNQKNDVPQKFYKVDEDLTLWIKLENPTTDRTVPAGTQFHLEQSEFYYSAVVAVPKPLPPGESCLVKVDIRRRATAMVDKFPGKITFNFQVGSFTQKGTVQLSTGFIRGDFVSPHPVNVLLFGSKGSGKSSLANCFVTCLGTGKEVSTSVTTLKSDDHVTTHYQKIWLGREIKDAEDEDFYGKIHDEVKLHIFDPWGIADKQEYGIIKLSHLLKGQLPPGSPMEKAMSGDGWVPSNDANRIHAVVFVVKVGALDNSVEMKMVNENIALASKEGYNPIAIITRMDEVDDPDEQIAVKKKAKDLLSVSGESIFFHNNYLDSTFRVPTVDLSTFFILRVIYERAKTWLRTNMRDKINSVVWKNETVLKLDGNPLPPHIHGGEQELWKCQNGHVRPHSDMGKFCNQCGKEYQPPAPPPSGGAVWKCLNGHVRPHSDIGKFCNQCGQEYQPPSSSGEWKCQNGHVRPPSDTGKFCNQCGKEYQSPSSGGAVWKCPSGHVRPPSDMGKFCNQCGKEYQSSGSGKVWACGNGHVRAAGDSGKFCNQCGEEYK